MKLVTLSIILILTTQSAIASYTQPEQASNERCEQLSRDVTTGERDLEQISSRIQYSRDSVDRLEGELEAARGTIENNISDCENYGEGCSFVNRKIERYNEKHSNYLSRIDTLNELVIEKNEMVDILRPIFTEYHYKCATYRFLNRVLSN